MPRRLCKPNFINCCAGGIKREASIQEVAFLYRSFALKSKSKTVTLLDLPGVLATLPALRGTDTLILSMEDFATKPPHQGPQPPPAGAPAIAAPNLQGMPNLSFALSAV